MKPLLSEPWISSLGWMLYHFLWQAWVAAGALWLANRLLRNASPRGRYACAWLALLLCAALPAITYARFMFHADPVTGLVRTVEAVKPLLEYGPITLRMSNLGHPILGLKMTASQQHQAMIVLPMLVAFWCAGSAFMLWRLRRGWSVMVWHIHSSTAAPASVEALLHDTSRQLGIKTLPQIKQSTAIASPVVMGVLRPVIVVPPGFADSLDEQQRMLLSHELAHVVRGDPWRNLVQCVIEQVLFWHPAALWISNRIRQERELCCDELAARALGHHQDLAHALAHLAEHSSLGACLSLGANRGSLLDRIRQLLDETFPRPMQTGRLLFAFATMPLALIAAFAAHVAMGPVTARQATAWSTNISR